MGQPRKKWRNLGEGKDIIDADILHGIAGHIGEKGFLRVLHEGYTTAPLHRCQSGSPIAQRPRKNGAHDAGSISERGGAKERVNRRPTMVLSRATHHRNRAAFEHHMKIGRRNIDASGLDGLAIARMNGRKTTSAGEEVR